MKTEDFIYKNIAKLLSEKYKDARPGVIAMAAKHGKTLYLKQGNFKGKAFDVCFKEAEKQLKSLMKSKV